MSARMAQGVVLGAARAVRAALTWWQTVAQSRRRGWRKRRAVGYQGLSVRWSNHRQSGAKGSRIQTGLPKAPARWAIAVSTVMTRSNWLMRVAVMAISSSWGLRSVRGRVPLAIAGIWFSSAQWLPFCRL